MQRNILTRYIAGVLKDVAKVALAMTLVGIVAAVAIAPVPGLSALALVLALVLIGVWTFHDAMAARTFYPRLYRTLCGALSRRVAGKRHA